MDNIFTLDNRHDFTEQINIDELYEYKKNNDLNKLALFQKILNRVHIRIKTTSKQKKNEHFCWYVVPEIMIGIPKYDQGECIAYIMDKLTENGFLVRYFHPNSILISWNHWVPTYVRTELKKKTGITVNEYGVKMDENITENSPQNNDLVFNVNIKESSKNSKRFTPINSYKPTGNLFTDSIN